MDTTVEWCKQYFTWHVKYISVADVVTGYVAPLIWKHNNIIYIDIGVETCIDT